MERLEIEYKGQDIKIGFTYEAGSLGVWRRSDGSGEPPTPPEVEIHSVHLGNYDITEMLEEQFEELSEIIIEKKQHEYDN
jgi:hypothetical protein